MTTRYILNADKQAVPCANLEEWAAMFEDLSKRRVSRTKLAEHDVSTVFLGLDHSFGDGGDPILFETMVFGPDGREVDCDRCTTWDQAVQMHEKYVAQYSAQVPPHVLPSPSDPPV